MQETILWNVKDNKETKEIFAEVLREVSKVLSNTLGPYGSTTIIEQPGSNYLATKDGLKVLQDINITEPTRATFLKMLKDISLSQVIKVGDGSTSSVVASYPLFIHLSDVMNKFKNIRSKELFDTINSIIKDIEKEIYKRSIKISDDLSELENIAMVSTNNDEELGKFVMEVFEQSGKHGVVNLKNSKSQNNRYDVVSGMRMNSYLIHNLFINDKAEKKAIIENAFVYMIDSGLGGKYLDTFIKVFDWLMAKNANLVVIAPWYDQDALLFIQNLFTKNDPLMLSKRLTVLMSPLNNDVNKDSFEDIALFTNCKYIKAGLSEEVSESELTERLGFVKRIEAKFDMNSQALFFEGDGEEVNKEIIQDRIKDLELEIKKIRLENEESIVENISVYELEKRLTNLKQGNIVNVYVGGLTEMEREANRDLLEDSIKACESALKYGYNVGGNIIISIVIKDMLTELCPELRFEEAESNMHLKASVLEAIQESFKQIFKLVYMNKYNDETCDLDKFNQIYSRCVDEQLAYDLINEEYTRNKIINSARTDVEIIRTTLSIVSLVLSSNQFINLSPRNIFNYQKPSNE